MWKKGKQKQDKGEEVSLWLAATGPAEATPTPDQISQAVAPFESGDTGDDPRYGERFFAIQEEVSRLSGADFELVRDEGMRLLAEEAKDLRVAGYVGLGLVARDGIAGLSLGLELMTALMEGFGDRVHPQRENARKAALTYLASDRVRGLLDQAADAGDAATRQRLDRALRALEDAASAQLGMTDLNLRALTEWLATTERQAELQAEQDTPEQVAASPAQSSAGVGVGTESLTTDKPGDDRTLETSIRRLLAYLRDNDRWAEHVAVARAWRWSDLTPPVADQGRTPVEPPRQAALAPIDSAMNKGQWLEGLASAERAFLEAGGQFLMRIQRLAEQCARMAGYTDSADRIETEVRLLRERLPQLESLTFVDGTPFVTEDDRSWLDRLGNAGGEVAEAASTAAGLDDGFEEARQRLADEGLSAALRSIRGDAYPPDDRGRSQLRSQQARLCLEADQAGSARAMLEGVWEGLRRGGHDRWDSALTCDVLRLLVRATEQDTALGRDERRRRSRELRDQLAAWDVSFALGS